MLRYRLAIFIIVGFWLSLPGCHTAYQAQSLPPVSYRITDSLAKDPEVEKLLSPYRSEVWRRMNDTIGYAAVTLEHKRLEGSLGNFFADALLQMARDSFHTQVDLAVINHGGLRLSQLPAGAVTRGKIFEVMPFDNLIVLQRLKGSVLQEFLDLAAAGGGWPVSGMTMQIRDKKAVHVMINGKPLDADQYYIVANSDFIANGGDNAAMLRSIEQTRNGYLMRDAFMDYIIMLDRKGQKISAKIENRVTHAE